MDVLRTMDNSRNIYIRWGHPDDFAVIIDCLRPILDMPLIDISTARLSKYRVQLSCQTDISEISAKGQVDLEFSAFFYLVSDFQHYQMSRPLEEPEILPFGQVVVGTLPVRVIDVNVSVSDPCIIPRYRILLDAVLLQHGGLLQAFDNDGLPKHELPLLIGYVQDSCLTITRVTQINGWTFPITEDTLLGPS